MALAVIAVEQLASFPSSLYAGVAERAELLDPEVVRCWVGRGGMYVNVKNGNIITSFTDEEALDPDGVNNILDGPGTIKSL